MPRQLRGQHAGTAHQQIDLDTILTGPDQAADQSLIGQCVHFQNNARAFPSTRIGTECADFCQQLAVQEKGRHQHFLHARQLALACQMQEHLLGVTGQLRIGGEVADVGVQARGARVVVASGQMRITPHGAPLAACDQEHLGMGFEPHHAIDHLGPDRLQHLRPVDIRFLVKTGLQLNNDHYLFAAAHGLPQQIHHLRIGPGAVNSLLDRQHLRVVHRLAQELQQQVEAFKGLVDQHIAFLQTGQHGPRSMPSMQAVRLIWGEAQARTLGQINQLTQAHQIDRPVGVVGRADRQAELLEQEFAQDLGTFCRYLQAHRLSEIAVYQALSQSGTQVIHVIFINSQIRVPGHPEL